MEALKKEVINFSVEDFYSLSKTILVKQEGHLDRFDVIFSYYFKGLEELPDDFFTSKIPKDWLIRQLMDQMTEEEKAAIEKMGGLDALMERFRELLKEQRERHGGGSKWIGTGGRSPFGAYGFNPEGFRIGQEGTGNRQAIKVWDQRQFRNLEI